VGITRPTRKRVFSFAVADRSEYFRHVYSGQKQLCSYHRRDGNGKRKGEEVVEK
jgi:hypothetical protein